MAGVHGVGEELINGCDNLKKGGDIIAPLT